MKDDYSFTEYIYISISICVCIRRDFVVCACACRFKLTYASVDLDLSLLCDCVVWEFFKAFFSLKLCHVLKNCIHLDPPENTYSCMLVIFFL